MKRKYPMKFFWFFVLTNFVFHFFCLFLPGVLLCLAGIWVSTCLKIGLAVLALDLILSITQQARISRAMVTSTHPDVVELMDMLNSPEGLHGVKEWADRRIAETPPVNAGEDQAG